MWISSLFASAGGGIWKPARTHRPAIVRSGRAGYLIAINGQAVLNDATSKHPALKAKAKIVRPLSCIAWCKGYGKGTNESQLRVGPRLPSRAPAWIRYGGTQLPSLFASTFVILQLGRPEFLTDYTNDVSLIHGAWLSKALVPGRRRSPDCIQVSNRQKKYNYYGNPCAWRPR